MNLLFLVLVYFHFTDLNVTSPQNVFLKGETWTGQRPERLQLSPVAGEEERIWETEPGTQITVTLKEEKANVVHSQKVKEGEHVLLKKAVEEERREQGPEERRDEKADEEKTAKERKQTQERDQSEDHPIAPSVDSPLASISPSQNFLTTVIQWSSLTTNAESPAVDNPDFSALKNTSILSINENSTHEDSSLGQIESSEKNAAPTAVEARIGPTAVSLPSTFKLKPKTKLPKIKGEQIAKTHKLQKEKKKVMSANFLKNAKQVKMLKQEKDQLAAAPYFPYFKDHYCPPDCACYGRCVSTITLHTLRLTSVIFLMLHLVFTEWCNVRTKGWKTSPTVFRTIPDTSF